MTISTLTSATTGAASTTANGASATQAAVSASPVAAALKKADARVQSQRDAAGAQLSSLGKLKSAVADAQSAAVAMGRLGSATPAADVKAALSRFVTGFNAAVAAARSTASAMASGDASTTKAASGARRVGDDLSRSLIASGGADAMRKVGLKQQADGTLTVDADRLATALKADPSGVQAALAKLGSAVDGAATRDLAAGSHIDAPMAALNKRASALKAQHDAMVTMAQQLSASSQSTPSARDVSYGISAYKSNA